MDGEVVTGVLTVGGGECCGKSRNTYSILGCRVLSAHRSFTFRCGAGLPSGAGLDKLAATPFATVGCPSYPWKLPQNGQMLGQECRSKSCAIGPCYAFCYVQDAVAGSCQVFILSSLLISLVLAISRLLHTLCSILPMAFPTLLLHHWSSSAKASNGKESKVGDVQSTG
jgi:hypothetical protein